LFLEQLEDRTMPSSASTVYIGIPDGINLVGQVQTPGRIDQIDSNGNVATVLQGALQGQYVADSVQSVAVEPDGNIDFLGQWNQVSGTFRFDRSTGSLTQISTDSGDSIAASEGGVVYVGVAAGMDLVGNATTPGRIDRIDSAGNVTTVLQGSLHGQFFQSSDTVNALAVEPGGMIDFLGQWNQVSGTFRFDRSTGSLTQISTDAGIRDSIAASEGGNVYVGVVAGMDLVGNATTPGRIDRIDSAGNVTTVLQGSLHGQFFQSSDTVNAVAVEPGGTIDFLGQWNQVSGTFRFDRSTGSLTQISTDTGDSIGVAPLLVATSLNWHTNSADGGGVDYSYQVSGGPTLQDNPVALYWASGSTFDTQLGKVAGTDYTIPSGTAAGTYTQHVEASILQSQPPPAGTRYLLLVVGDPTSSTFDPTQDVKTLAVPDLAATSLAWHTNFDPMGKFTDVGGGVTLKYQILNADLPENTSVGFYWTDNTDISRAQVKTLAVTKSIETKQGPYSVGATAADLGTPPTGAKYIVAYLDPPSQGTPQGQLIESDKTDNAANVASDESSILAPVSNDQGLDVGPVFVTPNGPQMILRFAAAGGALTISQAEILSGVTHFNWVQHITSIPGTWQYYEVNQGVETPIPKGQSILDPILNYDATNHFYSIHNSGAVALPVIGIFIRSQDLLDAVDSHEPYYTDFGRANRTGTYSVAFTDAPTRPLDWFSGGLSMQFTTGLVGVDQNNDISQTWHDQGTNVIWQTNSVTASEVARDVNSGNDAPIVGGGIFGIQIDTPGAVIVGPHAIAGGPYVVKAGSSVQLDASATTDPNQDPSTLKYEWDLNGNGIFGEVGSAATNGDETGIHPRFVPTGLAPGDHIVTLRVSDNAGLLSTDTVVIHLNQLPTPSFSNLSAPTITYGAASTTISGHLDANAGGQSIPTGETVQATLNGVGQTATLDSNDDFSATFDTSSLGVSGSPYTIGFSYAGDTNFSPTSGTSTLTVQPAPLTITADNQTKVYGDTLPALTVTYTGLVNGDTPGVFSAQGNAPPIVTTTATQASDVLAGGYPIAVNGAVDPNYTISYVSATLTITPAPLTITADNQTKVYGEPLPTLTVSYNGLVSGDTPSVFGALGNTPPTVTTTATQTSDVVTGGYAIQVSGAVDPNYTINYINGTLTITPANQAISWNNPADIVDGTPLGSAQLDATVSVVGPAPAGALTYTPPAGTVLGPGSGQLLTVTAATTNDYNSATAQVMINVLYQFSGFLPPLDKNLSFGSGRTVPIKFQLTDAFSNYISSLSAVTALQVNYPDGTAHAISGLRYDSTANQFIANWSTKGLATGSYTISLSLLDGTTHTVTIQITASKSSAGMTTVAAGGTGAAAGGLLGGDITLYVDNTNGDLTADELARIQDAVTAADAVTEPYGVAVTEVTDPTLADVTLNMDTTSAVGGYADGVLGCTTDAGQITIINSWNFYAGSDATQIGAAQYDFETVVEHELGHALGLGHSTDSTSVMYATLNSGAVNRALTTADLNVPDTGTTGACGLHAALDVIGRISNPSGEDGRDAFFAQLSDPAMTSARVLQGLFSSPAPDGLFANPTGDFGSMLSAAGPTAMNASPIFAAASTGMESDPFGMASILPSSRGERSEDQLAPAAPPSFQPDAAFDFIPANGTLGVER
jgi:hypothetical protein